MAFHLFWILALVHVAVAWVLAVGRGLKARQEKIQPSALQNVNFPPVSILVPAWKEKGTIELCIAALKKIDYPAWEALILAGGSDGTYEAAIQASVGDSRFRILLRGPEPKNVAITQGVQAAQHDILVLLDADSIVDRDWLKWLIAPIASGAAASFGMHYPSRETWVSLYEHMEHICTYQIHGSMQAAGCASQAIRREVLNRIGPLPANAFSWEDWDIDVRLMEAGEANILAPNARLLTDRPTTVGEYWRSLVRCQRSHLAGLWYHRKMVRARPLWGLFEILFYFVSFGVALAVLAGFIIAIVRPEFLPLILQIGVLGGVWILGRAASLAGEVAAFKKDPSWLWRGWSVFILLPLQFAASVVAVLGFWAQPRLDYKGPRVAPS